MANPATTPDDVRGGVSLGSIARGAFRSNEIPLLIALILLFVVVGASNPRFLSASNIQTFTRDIAMIGILAVGQSFAILTGGIDLSVGSVWALSAVMVAYLSVPSELGFPVPGGFLTPLGWPPALAIVVTLLGGTLIGTIHGLFVSKFKMHGFLITLVTLGLARGLATAITSAYPITNVPPQIIPLGQGSLFGLPTPLVIFIVIATFALILTRFTYIGRHIYAVGGNVEAARLSGVPVDRRIILCYAMSSFTAALVGIISAARLTSGQPGDGQSAELNAIAACVIGGVSLYGGQGTIFGVILGASIIGVLPNVMIILRISPYWQQIVVSVVLLIAIMFDVLRRRRQART